MWLLLAMAASAFGQSDAQNCYSRPAWILSGDEYWKGVALDAELPARNKIKVLRDGVVSWNGAQASSKQLDNLLRTVGQMKPQPLTQFEWEQGAPCVSIEEVRKLMKKHLKCAGSKNCMEGSDPRLPAPSFNS